MSRLAVRKILRFNSGPQPIRGTRTLVDGSLGLWLSLPLGHALQVLRLLKRREKWLVVVALRFLRTCVGLKVRS